MANQTETTLKSDRAGWFHDRSVDLSTQYEEARKREDLDQAIKYGQDAVNLTPKGNPDQASRLLQNLTDVLSMRYIREGSHTDLEQVIRCCQEAVNLTPKGNPD